MAMLRIKVGQPLFNSIRSMSISNRPIVESNHNFPKPTKLEADKQYKWCTCGQSAIQPMCDNAHRGSGFAPVKFTLDKAKTGLMCCCKNTRNRPYCDMFHFKVVGGNIAKNFKDADIGTPGDKPLVAGRLPLYKSLEPGKTYMWCTCGASKSQPFCDDSHFKYPPNQPLHFTVEKNKSRWLCRCKQTKNAPFCDSSHLKEEVQAAADGQLL